MRRVGQKMGIKDESESSVSEKVLKKAKSLSVAEITPTKWYVVGGESPHIVSRLGV